MHSKASIGAGFALLAAATLAGCGPAPGTSGIPHEPAQASSSSPPVPSPSTATTVQPQTASHGKSDFSRLIQAAMNQVPSGLVSTKLAATVLLNNNTSGDGTTNAKVSVINQGPAPGYVVRLVSGNSNLGEFGAAQYSTTQAARNASLNNPGVNAGVRSPTFTRAITLRSHTKAVASGRQGASNNAWSSVSFTSGRWKVSVVHYGTDAVPTPVAKEALQTIQRIALPYQQSTSQLFVDLGAQEGSLVVAVNWYQGRTEYFVDTYGAAINPLSSAVQVAASMERYP